jgi:hypothetical protein
MSSGQYKPSRPFNNTIIRDGWIVRIRKDGTIRSKVAPWEPGKKKKK